MYFGEGCNKFETQSRVGVCPEDFTCAFVAVHKAVFQFIIFQNFMDFLERDKKRIAERLLKFK